MLHNFCRRQHLIVLSLLILATTLLIPNLHAHADSRAETVAAINIPVGASPKAVANGDFNMDGKADLVTVNANNTLTGFLNNGNGNFSAPIVYAESNALVAAVGVADFNGDGKLDVVTILTGFTLNPNPSSQISVWFGNGNGTFAPPSRYVTAFYPYIMKVGDFNGDAKPDVIVGSFGNGPSCHAAWVQVWLNNGLGGLSATPTKFVRPTMLSIALGDYNGDGKLDLAVASDGEGICGAGGLQILLGDGTSNLNQVNVFTSLFPRAIESGDFNNDGKLDLLTPYSSSLSTLLGTGAGDFVAGTSISASLINPHVADFNNDGKLDVAGVTSNNSASILTGNGSGGFSNAVSIGTGLQPSDLTINDFNNDGRLDLAVANSGSNSISLILDVTTSTPPLKTLFDFDGDRKADIAVYREGNTPNAPSYWHILRSSDGVYQGIQLGANGDKPVPADYNGDGATEVAVWRPSNGTWYTSNNPAINYGAFQWGQNGDVPLPGDFDGDGKADYVVFRPSNGFWYLLRSSNGGFQQQQFGTSTDKPMLGDFDGDGKSDFAFYRPGASALDNSFWNVLQSSNGALSSAQFGRGEDKPVPADYDGDGRTNFAVFRPGTHIWYTDTNPATNYGAFQWGAEGDVPAPADYDADSKADFAVYRPGSTVWYILRSRDGGVIGTQWGAPSDRPIPSSFIP